MRKPQLKLQHLYKFLVVVAFGGGSALFNEFNLLFFCLLFIAPFSFQFFFFLFCLFCDARPLPSPFQSTLLLLFVV